MKKLTLLLIATLALFSVSAQETVRLTVNGQGATKEEAIAYALRSAIEQSFGVFVSANTQILNDEVVKEEIATIASGNIQEYKELGCVTMPNGQQSVTLSATVSIGNLISYAKSKGSSAEFAGQVFAMNIKMRKLNAENEEKAIDHMFKSLEILAKDMFKIELLVKGQPQVIYENSHRRIGRIKENFPSQPYAINIELKYHTTPNCRAFYDLLFNTLESLTLSKNDIETYNETNTPCYPFYYYDAFNYRYKNRERVSNDFAHLLVEKKYIMARPAHTELVANGAFLHNTYYSNWNSLNSSVIHLENEYNEVKNDINIRKKKKEELLYQITQRLSSAINTSQSFEKAYLDYITNFISCFSKEDLLCYSPGMYEVYGHADDRLHPIYGRTFVHQYTFRTDPQKILYNLVRIFATAQMEAYCIHLNGCNLSFYAKGPKRLNSSCWSSNPADRLFIRDFILNDMFCPSLHMLAHKESLLYYTSDVVIVVTEEELGKCTGIEIKKRLF